MKNRIVFFVAFSLLLCMQASAQLMSLGFVKNSMSYKRETYTDELKKKHFLLIQDKVETPSNMVLAGASYYSNSNKENVSPGEIKVLSLISTDSKITEITFSGSNYYNNYNDVFKQMVSFFSNQQSIKSKKYKTDVAKFSRDGVFYYAYKNGETPVILITDAKNVENVYFGN